MDSVIFIGKYRKIRGLASFNRNILLRQRTAV